jgi:hypothetical protein
MRTYLTYVTSDVSVIESSEEMEYHISSMGKQKVSIHLMTILTVPMLIGETQASQDDSLIECY